MNVANFFAARRGYEAGHIIEARVKKEDIIDIFLDDRNEDEVIVPPGKVTVIHEYPLRGLNFIEPILPEVAPVYHKYREQLESLSFAQDLIDHGPDHEARVLLLSLIIAHHLNLPIRDQKVLATASIFHDTQRTTDWEDSGHGKASREYYRVSCSSPDPIVEFLCEYHCLPDEVAAREIRNNRQLSKNRTRASLLYRIFKDADALDRVRFGIRDLDLKQLRLSISRELALVARICLEQIKLTPARKPSLSQQIDSAASSAVSSHSKRKERKQHENSR